MTYLLDWNWIDLPPKALTIRIQQWRAYTPQGYFAINFEYKAHLKRRVYRASFYPNATPDKWSWMTTTLFTLDSAKSCAVDHYRRLTNG